jgi:cobalamin biosynthetic protein CobC
VVAHQRLFQHGGDINSAAEAFPSAAAPWIDLSTGINAVPYPVPEIARERWTRLPSPAEVAALQAVAAARYGAKSEEVVVAPGTQAIIQMLPRLFRADSVAILGPTYSGHETAWSGAGADVRMAQDLAGLAGAAHCVVVNPNNPDGRRAPVATLRTLAADARLLVVDEAFADFEAETLCVDPPPNAVVLRSFGKTYGLAGLRLGFAVACAEVAQRLRAALGAWAVSGPALEIGGRALADADWLARTQARLQADARWLDERLARAGFEIVGGTPLFRLAARADAGDAFAALCRQGVLTRPFRARPNWLRFGLPAPDDRARVEAALQSLTSSAS